MKTAKKRQRVTITVHVGDGGVGRIAKLVHASRARAVMSAMAGRPLRADEEVRHMNGDEMDCRPQNLEMWCEGRCYGKPAQWVVAEACRLLAEYAAIT